jgi:2-dehydro-3-deoxygluconokinase
MLDRTIYQLEKKMKSYDVVTLGESMLRLTPPDLLRIEQTRSFDIYVGGSESNTAVGLSRLGMNVAWFSRLPPSPVGKYISNRIQQFGVDVSNVVWAEGERVGVYYHEQAKSPRASTIIYDRQDSAMSLMTPDELPTDLFAEGQSKLFHVTGITLAISETAKETVHEAVKLAKDSGYLVSFDTNYRSKLWSPEEAVAGCDWMMSQSDIIFCPMGDFRIMYGEQPPEKAIEILAEKYPNKLIVMTMGIEGGMARTSDGNISTQPAILAEEVGRIGGGDAFSAGFMYGYLTYNDVPTALKWGVAMSAHKYTIHGDLPLVDFDEVSALVDGEAGGGLKR